MSTLKSAFFIKNLPVWDRVLRLTLAAACLAIGFSRDGALGKAAFVSALVLTFTAVVGFCPMCALAGRRLASKG